MKPWDVKPLSEICMEKIKMWLCHVTKNKHGDECMQNMKEKEDFGSTRRPRWPKPLFVGAKAFMKAFKRGDIFFIYNFHSLDVEPHPH
jgi:hypothetical protein